MRRALMTLAFGLALGLMSAPALADHHEGANPCNPCNPCGDANPCNPCGDTNPCNPCGSGDADSK